MSDTAAIACRGLGHSYGERAALVELDLEIRSPEIFALLGPNGCGKSTLLRILATLIEPTRGTASVLGADVRTRGHEVRRSLGVAFQSTSLDGKLSVQENLRHQGHLHGYRGRRLAARIDELLETFRLADRARDRVATLSGGLARRLDLARAVLHGPPVLLLDEPSTGLDPTSRRDLLELLTGLRDASGATVLLTTHLTDEAARCDRVGILDRGRLVALGDPAELCRSIGGDVVTLSTGDAEELAADVRERFAPEATWEDGVVRLEREDGAELLPVLLRELGHRVLSATVARPSLEDVFLHRTGRAYHVGDGDA